MQKTKSNLPGEEEKFDTVTYTYDSVGNVLSAKTDYFTQYFYDLNGNVICTLNGLENIVDSPESAPESAGKTTFVYDKLGQVTQTTDSLGLSEKNIYDNFGNVVKFIDKNGNQTKYAYNSNALVSKKSGNDVVTYSYNKLGQLKSMHDKTALTNYTYDGFGRLTSEEANGKIKTYSYDNNGNRTGFSLTVDGENAINTTYAYDMLNRLATVTNNGETTTYAYDNNGNLLLSQTGENAVTYEYNNANMLKSQTNNTLGITYGATYYLNGNRRTLDETNKPQIVYTYDDFGKLINENASDYVINYSYDNRGNRTQKSKTEL